MTEIARELKPIQIVTEMRSSYLDYAMSVIVARALPDARDGLKPVQRRILYAMHDLGMAPTGQYRKCARLVGEVLGKYHPHGDAPVYDALVRMAQDFSLRYPLVDGQGNFGSVDGDPPAAMRYTEAKLRRIAQETLVNIDEETVDFVANFDDSLKEPVVLPSRLPTLLLNGASGIAVGMATSIPPHNLSEVCNGIVHLIRNPEASTESLLNIIKAPDFPTGGIIMGLEGTKNAYTTGQGRVIVRARAEIKDLGTGDRKQIIVTELPFQVNKASLVEKIAELSRDKKVDGISGIRDESDREGMRVVIELKRDGQPETVLNNLYKHTALQSSFSMNMLALVDGQPLVLNIKQMLVHFINFRTEIVERRSSYQLKKAKDRVHILEGMRTAISDLDAIIELIKVAEDVDSARQQLMDSYQLSQIQAQAILEMQLRRLTALDRQKLEDEYQELRKRIELLETLLSDHDMILEEVRKETLEIKKTYGDKRATEINEQELQEFRREDIEPHVEVVINISQKGYIKRIPSNIYRGQHRGGKGVRGMLTKDDDAIWHVLIADTHDVLLFFTDTGRVYASRVYQLYADSSRNTRGVPLFNVIAIEDREKAKAVLAVPNLQMDADLIMATRKGIIKRMPLRALINMRKNGLNAMNVKSGDELVAVRLSTGEEEEIIMASEQGLSIRFPLDQLPRRSRSAGGIIGMRLQPNDKVVGMDLVMEDARLLIISKNGMGKLTHLSKFRAQSRAGKGLIAYKITEKAGLVAAAEVVVDSQEVFVITSKAIVFRTNISEISNQNRHTLGVKIIKPDAGDSVTSLTCVTSRGKPAVLD